VRKALKMRKKVSIIVITSFFILTNSCIKKTDAGITTNVSGIVYDNIRQLPIANASIYIYEATSLGLYGPQNYVAIDSTKSDVLGKYSIQFKTNGSGYIYSISFQLNENYFTYYKSGTNLNIGKDTAVNFYATKFQTIKAEIQMASNPNPPMRVGNNIVPQVTYIWGINNDTTIYLNYLPGLPNEIAFNITNIDTPKIYNYQLDTVNFKGLQDTFNMTFNVIPKNFTGRE